MRGTAGSITSRTVKLTMLWESTRIDSGRDLAGTYSRMKTFPLLRGHSGVCCLGTFVVSLDFELHWGVRDRLRVEEYRENLLGVRRSIPAMLALFSEYGIRATWATVGFLFFETKEELLAAVPQELPQYSNHNLDPYAVLDKIGKNESEDPFHYAPSLIRLIQATAGQEIATHTFSHYYPGVPGPSLASFRADIRAAKSAAERLGLNIKSVVFPRNQVSMPHVRVCSEESLIAYRGVESDPYVAAGNGGIDRAKRLADHYVNLSGACCGVPRMLNDCEIVSVPQSRFLRPCSGKLRALEGLRLRRILSSMTFAAENNLLFHLWWHPHNFGMLMDRNLAFLRAILEHFRLLNRQFAFCSLTMAEVAETVLAESRAVCRES